MTINGHFSILSIHFCLDTTNLGFTLKLFLYPKPSNNELSYKEVPVNQVKPLSFAELSVSAFENVTCFKVYFHTHSRAFKYAKDR